jgi:spore coat polysaccharide biosynthesis protein SpsF
VRIDAVMQARMTSSRLPGKSLRPLGGKPSIGYLIERLAHSEELDGVVVATSDDPTDDPIAEFAGDAGVRVHRGPLANVAQRFLEAAERFDLDAFVRVSGDSPLLDQRLVDQGVRMFREGGTDIVTNVHPRTHPSGQSFEVVSADLFRRTFPELTDPQDLEHVTRFFYRHGERFRIRNLESERDEHELQLSVDSADDARVVEAILAAMDRPHWEYTSDEIIDLHHRLHA